ncbi:MAG: DUF1559 domain-containing protein [Planctomycetia bacterium]|nr:DUF1559 domain-containing protein [Planctomycetia bacterium]
MKNFMFRIILFACATIMQMNTMMVSAESELKYEVVEPYLTEKVNSLTILNLDAVDGLSFQIKLNEFIDLFIPQTAKDTAVKKGLAEGNLFLQETQKRIEAAKKLSGGKMFTVLEPECLLLIVPILHPDPDAEKLVMEICQDFPFFTTNYEWARELRESLNKYILIRKTEKAILFFATKQNTENPEEELTVWLQKARTPNALDYKKMIQKVKLGKLSTTFYFLGNTPDFISAVKEINEEIPKDLSLSEEEFRQILEEKSLTLAISQNDFQGTSARFSLIFNSEKTATNALKLMDFLISEMRKECSQETVKMAHDDSGARIEMRPVSLMKPLFDDSIRIFNDTLRPRQEENVLTLDLAEAKEKFTKKYLTFIQNYLNHAKSLRTKHAQQMKAELARQAKVLASWTTQETAVIMRLDVERFDLPKMGTDILKVAKNFAPNFFEHWEKDPTEVPPLTAFMTSLKLLNEVREILLSRGITEIYVFVDFSDMNAPVKIVCPNLSEPHTGHDTETGIRVSLTEFAGKTSAELNTLLETFNSTPVGQWRGNLIALFGAGSPDETWENFVKEHHGEAIPEIEEYLAATENASVSMVFRMTTIMKMGFVPFFFTFRNELKKDFSDDVTIPSVNTVINGLNVITLGLDPEQGIFALNIFSKDEHAADKITALLDAWQKEIPQLLATDLPEDTPSFTRPLLEDTVNVLASLIRPIQEGKRFKWDYSENSHVRFLKENMNHPAMYTAAAGLGMGLLLPAVQSAREAAQSARETAQQMQIQNNFSQIYIGMMTYEYVHGALPPAYTVDKDGKPLHSWRVLILPYLEHEDLYAKIRLDEPWDSPWNQQFHNQCPKYFQSPQNPDPAMSVFSVVVGKDCIFEPVTKKDQKGTKWEDITDGMANTILLTRTEPVCWMDPHAYLTLRDVEKRFTTSDTNSHMNKKTFFITADGFLYDTSETDISGDWKYYFLKNDGKIPGFLED